MSDTSIEWTDRSVNPILARLPGAGDKGGYNTGVGHYCEKVSPGCKNCYSSALQPRFGLPQFQEQRGGVVEPFFHSERLSEVLRRKKPTKFFWSDMTDMFGDWVPFEWIAACFGVMAATPQHTHQILTKRPARMLEFFAWVAVGAVDKVACHADDALEKNRVPRSERASWFAPGKGPRCWPLPNIHLGVSCENQATADERVPLLLRCPAAVRFVSAEPLIGPVDLNRATWAEGKPLQRVEIQARMVGHSPSWRDGFTPLRALNWVIVGSESGPGARPMELAWAESLRDQCAAEGVAFFTKQIANTRDRKGGNPEFWPGGPWPREFPAGAGGGT